VLFSILSGITWKMMQMIIEFSKVFHLSYFHHLITWNGLLLSLVCLEQELKVLVSMFLFVSLVPPSLNIANILPPSLNQSWMPLFVSFWCISCSTTAKKMLKNKQTALHPCLSPCLNMKGLEHFFYSTKFCNLPLHKAFKILTAHWHSGWMFIVSQYL